MKFPIGDASGAAAAVAELARRLEREPVRCRSAATRAGWRSRSIRRRRRATGRGGRGRGGAAAQAAPAAGAPARDAGSRTRWRSSISPPARRRSSTRFAASPSTATSRLTSPCRAILISRERPRARHAGAAAGGAAAPAPGRPEGTDLVLYNLSNGDAVNVGNVAEFGFDDSGEWLAYTDRRARRDRQRRAASQHAHGRRAGDRFRPRAVPPSRVGRQRASPLAVLRGKPDSLDARHALLGRQLHQHRACRAEEDGVRSGAALRVPGRDEGRRRARAALLRRSVDGLLRHQGREEGAGERPRRGRRRRRGASIVQAGAPGAGGTINQPRVTDTPDDNPSLILWHAKDPRLQSQQIVQEAGGPRVQLSRRVSACRQQVRAAVRRRARAR